MFRRRLQENPYRAQHQAAMEQRCRAAYYAPGPEPPPYYRHGSTGDAPIVLEAAPYRSKNHGFPSSDLTSKFLYTDPVVVHVGHVSKRFMIHKNLVCRDSTFFQAACKGGFREADSNEVKLPHDEPETFDNFVQWLYTRDFERPMTESGWPNWECFFDIYVLADKLGAPKFSNHVMNLMVHEAETRWDQELSLPDAAAVCAAYENTPGSSPLRRFLVDLYCCNNKLEIPKQAVPDEFVMEMAFTLKRRIVESGGARRLWSYDGRPYQLEIPV